MRFAVVIAMAALTATTPSLARENAFLDFDSYPNYEGGPLYIVDNVYFTGFDNVIDDSRFGRVARFSSFRLNSFGFDPQGNPQGAGITDYWIRAVDKGDGRTFNYLNGKIIPNYRWTEVDTSFREGLTASPGDEFLIDRIQFSYDLGTVPEPATWAMLILGFGTVGTALRRRRNSLSHGERIRSLGAASA